MNLFASPVYKCNLMVRQLLKVISKGCFPQTSGTHELSAHNPLQVLNRKWRRRGNSSWSALHRGSGRRTMEVTTSRKRRSQQEEKAFTSVRIVHKVKFSNKAQVHDFLVLLLPYLSAFTAPSKGVWMPIIVHEQLNIE